MSPFAGYLSTVTPGGVKERHVAYQLASVGRPSSPGYDRRSRKALDEMVDASVGDAYALHAALVAEKTYLDAPTRTKQERQAVSDAFKTAAAKLHAKSLHVLASQALVCASRFDTSGQRGPLAEEAAQTLVGANLGESDPAATRWAATSIVGIRKEIPAALLSALHSKFLDQLKAGRGQQSAMDYHSKSALELAQTEDQKIAVHREHVQGLEAAANGAPKALMKDHFLEEAVKICTHLLEDHAEARRLQGLRSDLDIMAEMAVIEQPLGMEKEVEEFRQRLLAILAEARPEDGPEGIMTALVHGLAAPPPSMPRPDAKRKPTLMDQLGMQPVIYSETEKTQKRPKQPMMRAVALERSIAYQIFQYQAIAASEVLTERLFVPLHVSLVELSGAQDVPDWVLKLRPVVRAYLDADYYTAGSMGCIAFESIMRDCWLAGGKAPQYYRDESSHNSILSGLLEDPVAKEVLGKRTAMMAQYMFDSEDGPNLRNTLLHGLADPRRVGYSTAATILYLLLHTVSALLRFERGQRPQTDVLDDSEE